MKNALIFAVVVFSTAAYANINMRPGLWEIETKMKSDRGESDPSSHMKESIAKMSPAQKKQMETMMAKHGMGMGNSGMKVCYSEETVKNPEALSKNSRQQDCTSKITSRTASRIASEFSCANGTKGEGVWNFRDKENYDGTMDMVNAKGEKTRISHKAHFLSTDCGNVKPLQLPSRN